MAIKQKWEAYISEYESNMPLPTPDNIGDYARQLAYLRWLEKTYKQYEDDWDSMPDNISMTAQTASGIYQSRLDHEWHAVIIAPFSGESTVMAQSDEFTVTVSMETYSGGTLPEMSSEYYDDGYNVGVRTAILNSGYNVKQDIAGAPYFYDSTFNNGNTGRGFYTCNIDIRKTGTPGEQSQNTFGSAYDFIGHDSTAQIGTGGLLTTITGDIDTENPWDYYNNNILPDISPNNAAFPNGYGKIKSPFSLKLWSIKETKDDIKVANTFPYSGYDAGDGVFFSLIRPKIKYDSLERDSDSSIVIKGLKFQFEDAVRKICQKEGSDIPENFLLAAYNFKDINSYSDFIPIGSMKKGNTSKENPSLVALKDNSTIGAFYKGQLISNYSISNPSYKISVATSWKGKPDFEDWQGTAQINIINTLTKEIVGTQTISEPINNTYTFYLPSHMESGEEIPYKIIYEINDPDNNWTVEPIQNNTIYYKDEKHSINIINNWNKIAHNNVKTVIINEDYYDTDFTSVYDFFVYLRTKKAIFDWEQIISNNINCKKMKENTIRIFCAQYKWFEHDEENLKECFILIPFLSIVIKDIYGIVNIYSFHIRSPYVIDSDTPLKKDMYNGSLNIIWPYISKREYKQIPNNDEEWQLGAESTKLFGRKGCYEESNGTVTYSDWTSDKDIYYKQPPSGKTSSFYIGAPHTDLLNQRYTTVNNSIVYSDIEIQEDNGKFLLNNFCIYCIDENCTDETNVEMVIPYYYKAKLYLPYGRNDEIGLIRADVYFNDKSNYWNINAPDIDVPDDPPYKAHKWKNYGTDNYIAYQDDFIIPNKEKIKNNAAENMVGQSFFDEANFIID